MSVLLYHSNENIAFPRARKPNGNLRPENVIKLQNKILLSAYNFDTVSNLGPVHNYFCTSNDPILGF